MAKYKIGFSLTVVSEIHKWRIIFRLKATIEFLFNPKIRNPKISVVFVVVQNWNVHSSNTFNFTGIHHLWCHVSSLRDTSPSSTALDLIVNNHCMLILLLTCELWILAKYFLAFDLTKNPVQQIFYTRKKNLFIYIKCVQLIKLWIIYNLSFKELQIFQKAEKGRLCYTCTGHGLFSPNI